MRAGQAVNGLRTAFTLLTRFPVPTAAPEFAASRNWFWVAGLAVGALAASVYVTAALVLPFSVAALLALGAEGVATGFLHWDGWADTSDGFWGGHTRERRLEIMRDAHIGTYGTMALILGFAAAWQVLALLGDEAWKALLIGACWSRQSAAVLAMVSQPARPDGFGRTVIGSPFQLSVLLVCVPPVLLSYFWWASAGILALALAAGSGLAVRWLARKKIGGMTGDVLGASVILSQLVFWLSLLTLHAI